MRVLLVEQKWGVHTDKGTPITYQVTEQWESLSTATEVVEKSLEKDGLTWRTRKLAADLVEIDSAAQALASGSSTLAILLKKSRCSNLA